MHSILSSDRLAFGVSDSADSIASMAFGAWQHLWGWQVFCNDGLPWTSLQWAPSSVRFFFPSLCQVEWMWSQHVVIICVVIISKYYQWMIVWYIMMLCDIWKTVSLTHLIVLWSQVHCLRTFSWHAIWCLAVLGNRSAPRKLQLLQLMKAPGLYEDSDEPIPPEDGWQLGHWSLADHGIGIELHKS